MFLNLLKDRADEEGLVLNPEVISCDFEQGAIKAFKRHFPNAKIAGCHFHFSSAIYKKLCELGLKKSYSENKNLKKWTRMIMAFPYLKTEEIDESWGELNIDMDLVTN